MSRRWVLVGVLGVAACAAPRVPALFGPPPEEPVDAVRALGPFLQEHCLRCHSGEDPEGGVSFPGLRDAEALRAEAELWNEVLARARDGSMPPAEEPQPSRAARAAFVAALRAALGVRAGDPGRVTIRRLNRAEYNASVQDLLGVGLRPADAFPRDESGHGFDTVGDALSISPLLLEKYLAAAERLVEEALVDPQPFVQRVAGDRLEGGGNARGKLRVFASTGRAGFRPEVRTEGRYRVIVEAWADQAGPDPARIEVVVDGQRVAVLDTEGEGRDQARSYEAEVALSKGRHRVEVGFPNDYYRPQDPDPSQRDRNLIVLGLTVAGPLEPPRYSPLMQGLRELDRSTPEAVALSTRLALAPLMTRAFRRALRDGELERYAALADAARAEGAGFYGGLKRALTAVLISPHFLFRPELDADPSSDAVRDLDGYELASRLSYFLWCSLPDDAALRLAAEGALRGRLVGETRRLLADPRADRFVAAFAGQWLGLRRLEDVDPDPASFPGFDDALRAAMRAESELVLTALLRENRSVLELLDGEFTFVNERLAAHYGIPGVEGERFRRVRLPAERRGVLTHASVLTVTSNPTRTSPVQRGKWILEQLLDDPPPPPPPGAGDLPDDPQARAEKSGLERLQDHQARADCRSCHAKLDPLGVALEGFDGVGAFRVRDGRHPIDDTGTLPDGTVLAGAPGLS
ncbi:MAG: DUF1592 domain-containing protein, partial [Planctomycetes bacterium]|nr:DUF1592 domain-containing protein [Planctomycetota bacterium]